MLTCSRLVDSACRALRAIANTRVAHVVLHSQEVVLKFPVGKPTVEGSLCLFVSEFFPALPAQRGLWVFLCAWSVCAGVGLANGQRTQQTLHPSPRSMYSVLQAVLD